MTPNLKNIQVRSVLVKPDKRSATRLLSLDQRPPVYRRLDHLFGVGCFPTTPQNVGWTARRSSQNVRTARRNILAAAHIHHTVGLVQTT
eukprot:scaffold35665_cov214-Amphora_coffeaeformis.AAC.2